MQNHDRAASAEAADIPRPEAPHLLKQRSLMGFTLHRLGKPVFEGVYDGKRGKADRRHAANRVARRSRRTNRDRGSSTADTAIRYGALTVLALCALASVAGPVGAFFTGGF